MVNLAHSMGAPAVSLVACCLVFAACHEGGGRRRCEGDAACDGPRALDAGGAVPDATAPGPTDGGPEEVCPEGGECSGPRDPGPNILELTPPSGLFRSNDTWIATARVTDPDGADDIASATLIDADTRAVIATFVPVGAELYQAEITWPLLARVVSISTGDGRATLLVTARFVDRDGHEATRALPLGLACRYEGQAICDTSCVDLESDIHHCGSCGRMLEEDQECVGGEPLVACTPDEVRCEAGCTDRQFGDYRHCGRCDHPCPPFPGLAPVDTCYERECKVGYSQDFGLTDATQSCDEVCRGTGTAYAACDEALGVEILETDIWGGEHSSTETIGGCSMRPRAASARRTSTTADLVVRLLCACEAP